jgi:3-hydroxybutyryl-CoA dehydrogenase
MEIQRIGIIGVGLMGAGIAKVCACAGYDILVREINDELLVRGLNHIEASLQSAVQHGKLTSAAQEAIRSRVRGTTRLEDFADRDLVIEAAIEDVGLKKDLFAQLDQLCPPGTILTSNTSSIPIIQLAAATQRPDRVLGMHFFNPVPTMRLIELVRTLTTSDETLETARAVGEHLGKRMIVSKDRAGFIVNYLLIPYLLDAIRLLEQEFASKEDIDVGMMLGTSYPMGPFTLLDFIGLDTALHISEVVCEAFKEPRFAAPTLLRQMVAAGWLGRKSGRGFYHYQAGERPPR